MQARIQRCGYLTFFKAEYGQIFDGSGLMDLVFFCVCCKKSSKVAEIGGSECIVAEMLHLLQKMAR